MDIKNYIKANKSAIVNNWRKNEFIREKYNFSILSYIYATIEHMANDIFHCQHEQTELKTFAQWLYKTI